MGKDTLAKHLREGTYKQKYIVYGKRDSSILDSFKNTPVIAFANTVKDRLSQDLGYPFPEDHKDKSIPGGSITYRQLCIKLAETQKLYWGNDYWAKETFLNLTSSQTIISDWRFPDEYTYLLSQTSIITIRVYRKEVSIPPLEETTEHQLDSIETDYFMCPSEADYEEACRLFPYLTKLTKLTKL